MDEPTPASTVFNEATAHLPQPPTSSIGQYELLHELGGGGMGVVWLAHDTVLGRQVAIKVLKPGLHDPSKRRLLREAKSAAQLSHPNVISIFHVLEENGQVFIIMELLGKSLAEELRDRRGTNWREATTAIRDAAAGPPDWWRHILPASFIATLNPPICFALRMAR
jgi:serine/threonine protein kinase